MKKFIQIYDTTLRDGTQSEDVALSVEDKLRIAEKLDWLGIHYIEGGWPGASPKDTEFFKRVRTELKLKKSRVSAFGSTMKPFGKPETDFVLNQLLDSGAKTICIFGKTWDLHVHKALNVPLEENLRIIHDSIAYLKKKKREVFFDAEHFFDGYQANKSYALKALKTAKEAGADCLVLCDTNGGAMSDQVFRAVGDVKKKIRTPLGIHCHNDAGLGVANSMAAVAAGVTQVQGTINGLGERCGNANLCSIIPNLELKLGHNVLGSAKVARLTETAKFISEICNLAPDRHQPYVGSSAFAHKGGIHIDAMLKDARTYEHVPPQKVGNARHMVISDYSGVATLIHKAKELGIALSKEDTRTKKILDRLKELENTGFQFEGAEASLEVLLRKELGLHKPHFQLISFKVTDEISGDVLQCAQYPSAALSGTAARSHAEIVLEVDGHREQASAVGVGPVHALDRSLRKALERFYPVLSEVKLIDYKVRVLSGGGTASSVRVLLECADSQRKWGTVGVSENIIQASYQALLDSIDYKLIHIP